MNAPIEYLEATKVDEIAKQLKHQGYKVEMPSPSREQDYDLIASKNGHTIVVEVKARQALQKAAKDIERLRKRAREQGIDEFRLVVVDPPHETKVEIEGLEDRIFDYMVEHVPTELDDLSTNTRIDDVNSVDVDSIMVTADGIRVAGKGVVEVQLAYAGGEARDGASWGTDFPFEFDVLLSRDLHINAVESMTVNTSSFYE